MALGEVSKEFVLILGEQIRYFNNEYPQANFVELLLEKTVQKLEKMDGWNLTDFREV